MEHSNDTIPKQGHKCCGFCCDVRRAVIIVNIVSIVLQVFIMFALPASASYIKNNPDEFDTDDKQKEQLDNINWGSVLGIGFMFIVVYLVGIIGAIRYNVCMIGFAGLSYFINMILAFVFGSIPSSFIQALVPALFLYPHIVLIQEIRTGLMTPESYRVSEEYSCCCV